MPGPEGPPKTTSAKSRAPDDDGLSMAMRYANRRAELLYHKLSETCEGEPLAVVALAAIGLLVNTTRGREALDQASAKRVVLAWLNETFVNAEAFDAKQDGKRRSVRRAG
jgi:hypothetical protein